MERLEFEQAYQFVSGVGAQFVYIDFPAVIIWIDKIMGQEALRNETVKANMGQLKRVFAECQVLREVMLRDGVPVRDPEEVRKAYAEQIAKMEKEKEQNQPIG